MLRAAALSVDVKNKRLLRDLTFEIATGELVVLTGPNGAGKSVLLRALAGIIPPSSGTVVCAGDSCPADSRDAVRVALVFQEPDTQILGRTVEEDLSIGRPGGRASSEARVRELLDLSDLSALRGRLCHTLSGGEKRRLSIASALALEPRILLLDEPFTYLDFPSAVQTLSLMLRIRDLGCGVLLVTHELDRVLAHAHRLAVLHGGRLVFDGPPAEAMDRLSGWDVRKPRGEIADMTWLPSAVAEKGEP